MEDPTPFLNGPYAEGSWQSRLMLVVEDSDDDYFLLTRAFRKAGIFNPVRRVENGKQAISYLEEGAPYADRTAFPFPYLVLLDLKMPILHGFGVLDWARGREETKLLPFLIFSSSSQDIDVKDSYLKGANGYVTKSTSLASLTNVVAAIHSYWLKVNQVKELLC